MLKRINLSGWWKISFDKDEQGEQMGWAQLPPKDCLEINLPSCWNEVFPDYFNYEGTAWYFKEIFFAPSNPDEGAVVFRGG